MQKKYDLTIWAFLFLTFFTTIICFPLYLYNYGVDFKQLTMMIISFFVVGTSITLGYHRLFSHLSFEAHPIVKFITLFFGAGAFENSAIAWCSDHRHHHKNTDHHDDDPYSISRGLFYAHIGWVLFRRRPDNDFSNVPDLKKDPIVMLQHRNYMLWAFLSSYALPFVIAFLWGGVNAGILSLLYSTVRVTLIHHSTFCINSLCHWVGKHPYSSRTSARDSWLMALFTFGEGYHNYHHEFQHDYRNGVKKWQFDPTKWCIYLLSKIKLTKKLKRVDDFKIVIAEVNEITRTAQSMNNVWWVERLASLKIDLENGFITVSQIKKVLLEAKSALYKTA